MRREEAERVVKYFAESFNSRGISEINNLPGEYKLLVKIAFGYFLKKAGGGNALTRQYGTRESDIKEIMAEVENAQILIPERLRDDKSESSKDTSNREKNCPEDTRSKEDLGAIKF